MRDVSFFPFCEHSSAAHKAAQCEPLRDSVDAMRHRLANIEQRQREDEEKRSRLEVKRAGALANKQTQKRSEATAATSKSVERARHHLRHLEEAAAARARCADDATARRDQERDAKHRLYVASELQARRERFNAQLPAVRERLADIDAKLKKKDARTNELLKELGCIKGTNVAAQS